jgi:hypothetical protein
MMLLLGNASGEEVYHASISIVFAASLRVQSVSQALGLGSQQ